MRSRGVLLALVLALPVPLRAPAAQFPPGRVGEAALSFDAHATAGDFTGITRTVEGRITGGDVTEVRGWVEAPVATLTTGNGRRDRDMNRSLESDKYPTMRFELAGVRLARDGAHAGATHAADSLDVTLHGTLFIHGVSRVVVLPARVLRAPGGVRVRSDFPLNVKDYEVGGLTKLLGMLKMHPEILVHVDLTFVPDSVGPPPADSAHGSTLTRP